MTQPDQDLRVTAAELAAQLKAANENLAAVRMWRRRFAVGVAAGMVLLALFLAGVLYLLVDDLSTTHALGHTEENLADYIRCGDEQFITFAAAEAQADHLSRVQVAQLDEIIRRLAATDRTGFSAYFQGSQALLHQPAPNLPVRTCLQP